MKLDTLINNLTKYIDRNELVKADVAKKIGVSPSGLSHLLSRNVNPTGEQALAILNLTKGNKSSMNTTNTTDESLDAVNAGVLARYAKNHAQITHFNAIPGNDGWVPKENVNSANDDFAELIDALNNLASNDPITLKARLADLLKGYKQVSTDTVPKASPNPNGTTRDVVTVRGGERGQRGTWIDGQKFDRNGGILNVDAPGLLEFARNDVNQLTEDRTAKSHKLAPKKFKIKGSDTLNFSRVDMEHLVNHHNENLLADKETYSANVRRIDARKAKEIRLANGNGTLEDLSAKFNSFKA